MIASGIATLVLSGLALATCKNRFFQKARVEEVNAIEEELARLGAKRIARTTTEVITKWADNLKPGWFEERSAFVPLLWSVICAAAAALVLLVYQVYLFSIKSGCY